MAVVATAGLGVSAYLSWVALTSSKVAGCGGGNLFDCGHVLQSKWSTAFGVPVGVPATGIYAVVLLSLGVFALTKESTVRKSANLVLAVCATAAAFAAIWFIYLQLFVVAHLCSWCLAAHSCSLILASLVLWHVRVGKVPMAISASLSFLAVGVMAVSQINAEEPQTHQIKHFPAEQPALNTADTSDESDNLFLPPGFEEESESDDQQLGDPTSFRSDDGQNLVSFNDPDHFSQSRQSTRSFGVLLLQLIAPQSAMISALPVQEEAAQEKAVQEEGEAKSEQAEEKKDQEEPRIISLNGGAYRLDASHWPLAGKKDADLVFVEMFDYTCPHCRENHRSIKDAVARIGEDKVAILAFVTPLNANCNNTLRSTDPQHAEACDLARIAIAVWRVDAEKFGQFHEWMFEGHGPPTAAKARTHAQELVGKDELEKELSKKIVGQYIQKQVDLYNKLGAGTVPKMMFPSTTVTGKVGSAESMLAILKQQMPKK
jgi:protein-disulfide isomerase/uncharacterized membrane protein